jgi:hypothetical protein
LERSKGINPAADDLDSANDPVVWLWACLSWSSPFGSTFIPLFYGAAALSAQIPAGPQ